MCTATSNKHTLTMNTFPHALPGALNHFSLCHQHIIRITYILQLCVCMFLYACACVFVQFFISLALQNMKQDISSLISSEFRSWQSFKSIDSQSRRYQPLVGTGTYEGLRISKLQKPICCCIIFHPFKMRTSRNNHVPGIYSHYTHLILFFITVQFLERTCRTTFQQINIVSGAESNFSVGLPVVSIFKFPD